MTNLAQGASRKNWFTGVVTHAMLVLTGAALCLVTVTKVTEAKMQHLRYEQANGQTVSFATVAQRDRELKCLAQNIYYEAGSEPFEGKVAVAQVTINRATSGKFPKDICAVVYQRDVIMEKVICQFSWYCEQPGIRKAVHKAAFDESMAVAKKVLLEGFMLDGLKEAIYFHADYVRPRWGLEKVAHIGGHIFYSDKKATSKS